MARIRSVKPELCTSETMALVSAEAERTFIRLWTHCDDDGRAKDHPKLLKASLFPLHDDVTTEDVDRHLWELADHGLIARYEVDGERFLHVPSWPEHQKPQKRIVSKLPAPDLGKPYESRSGRVALQEDYGPVVVGEGSSRGVVEVGVGVAPSNSGQPQLLEPAPALDVEQATNRAVGMLANLRAVGGDNPAALAAHIGRTLPDHERVELGELIAAGVAPAEAAAALADPLRGLQAVPGGRHDPVAVQAAADRAKRAEEATRARLDASTVHAPTRPPAGLRDALNGATA